MSRYRKKPVEVEAREWDGTAEGATQLINWMLDNDTTARFREAESFVESNWPHTSAKLLIDTLEGTMHAYQGYWIVCGVAGEFYPVKGSIFRETYEPADGEAVPS
jgi:hypothetical protein